MCCSVRHPRLLQHQNPQEASCTPAYAMEACFRSVVALTGSGAGGGATGPSLASPFSEDTESSPGTPLPL